jgi:peptidoglycan/LPS O-acetylase OafA/YrhL
MTAAHFGSALLLFDIFNFYSVHSRIWELLLGSLVAYLHVFKQIEKNKYSNILKFISLLLIILSVIYFDENIPHPSLFTLIPAVSTAVIILFGQNKDLISRLLSLKFIVFIGLISYSLYLWHFPLFAYARITEFTRGNFENKIILGVFIILISILSYFFIEKPFRNKKLYFKKVSVILFIPLIFIIVFNIFSIYKNGFYNNAPAIIKKNFLTNPSYNLLRDGSFKVCDDNINFNTKLFFY